jgi:hypothetical protein
VTGTVVIIVIAILVLAAGFLLAKKAFVRGSMAETPSEDRPTAESVGAQDDPEVSHDPRAVGRPSDRGYEQKL